jgi:hypothetical protein
MFQANALAMRPLAFAARNRFLFILGHMRSGSSLLCHLLCNSPDIIGFGEAHNSYRRRTDLAKLLAAVLHHTGENPMKYRYVLDKVVGQQHILNPPVLTDNRTRYVFLVREPLASIASIVAMRRMYHDESPQQLISFATNYYSLRLTQLVDLANTIDDPERCLLVTHRQLLNETHSAFEALEELLDLSAPLHEDYKIMPTTGKPGMGDPTSSILRGTIDRSLPRKHVDLPARLQARMTECYSSCIAQLCNTMPAPASHSMAIKKLAA